MRLSRKFDVAARRVRTPKDVPNIRQSQPPAILKIPVAAREAGQFGLKIELRVQDLDDQFVSLEGITAQQEFHRKIEWEWHIAFGRYGHVSPLEIAGVRIRARRRCIVVQNEIKITAVYCKRCPPVVIGNGSVLQFQVPDAKIK